MKKIYFLLLLFVSTVSFSQIWTEDFSTYAENTGIEGDGSGGIANIGDYPGSVTKWTLDASNSGIYNASDWTKTIGGTLSFRDTDGAEGVIWESESIDISSATSAVTFQLTASNNSGGFETSDFYDVYYSIDGGAFTLIANWNGLGDTDHTILGQSGTDDWATTETISQSGISGNTLQIRVRAKVNAGPEQFFLDDISVFEGAAPPSISITSPANNQVFPSGTIEVPVSIIVQNFDVGATTAGLDGHIHWTLNGNQTMKYDVSDVLVPTIDGGTYEVVMTLVDNNHTPITPTVSATVNFSVAYPCDIVVGNITTTCDAETTGTDTYTTTIEYTGGANGITYTVTNGNIGTITEDVTNVAAGTITITGVDEMVDFTLNIAGEPTSSSCNINTYISAPTCLPSTCGPVGSIIITEIMQNPASSGNDPAGEYFEVYNTTGAAIDLSGWIISDAGSDSHAIASSVVVPAGGYAVLANGATTIPVADYSYGGDISLANGDDEIILTCSGNIIDEVYYDDGGANAFPDPNGAAMELSVLHLDATSNDLGANWGVATNDLGNGDFGTPGAENDFSLSVNTVVVNTFNVFPNPTNTGIVNITSKTNETITVSAFNILGKQVLQQTLTNNVLNVSKLNSGVYILKIAQNGNTITKKLVIK
ncbi:MAG: lamin tail domain-containing protein [Oceanihabitans sp.]